MSIFNFTTPDGQKIQVVGPSNASLAEARAIFEKQLNTGSLVGITPGTVLDALSQAKAGLTSAYAQATEGFSLGTNITDAVTAISQGAAGAKLPNLTGIPVVNPINAADFVKQSVSQLNIGAMGPAQIQGLVAQAGAATGQAADIITNEKGLGKFGLDASQLQTAGLIKPGVADQIAQDATQFKSILSSPSVWTGKSGVTDIDKLLDNSALQSQTQQKLMDTSLTQLKQLGTVTGSESVKELGAIVQTATKFGAGAATAFVNGTAPSNLINQLTETAKQAEFSTAFAALNAELAGGGNPLQSGIQQAKGFANTVNRKTVNAGTSSIIGNAKIPAINFGADPYENTKDEDLTYAGSDEIVLSRINEVRARRGLAALPSNPPIGNQPADAALVEENKALRKEIKGLLERIIAVRASDATPDQADAKIAQLTTIEIELDALRTKATGLRSRVLTATTYSETLYQQLNEEVGDIGNAIINVLSLIQSLRQLKQQAQQQA